MLQEKSFKEIIQLKDSYAEVFCFSNKKKTPYGVFFLRD